MIMLDYSSKINQKNLIFLKSSIKKELLFHLLNIFSTPLTKNTKKSAIENLSMIRIFFP